MRPGGRFRRNALLSQVPSMPKTQTYETHRRFLPLHHFVAQPLVVVNLALTTKWAIDDPSFRNIWQVVIAILFIAIILGSRQMALIVQNRLIRLEMRLRLREVLPPALASRIGELRVRQLIGLRFAGDAELPGLVERCLKGELKSSTDVKKAITDWQPDLLRA
jgi:hypothetical protein